MSLNVEQGVVIHFDSYGRIGKVFDTPINLSSYKQIGIEFTEAPMAENANKIKMCWTDGQLNTSNNKVFCTSDNIVPKENKTTYTFDRPVSGWSKTNGTYTLNLNNITEFGIYYGSSEGSTAIRVNRIFLVKEDEDNDDSNDIVDEYTTLTTLIKSYHVTAHQYHGEVTFVAQKWGELELFNENLKSLTHESTDQEDCTYNITFSEATPQTLRLRFQYYDSSTNKWYDCKSTTPNYYLIGEQSTSFSQEVPNNWFAEHACERVVLSYVAVAENQTFKFASITRGGHEVVTIGSTGYTTYTTPAAKMLEFSRVAGLKAYIVTARNSSTGVLTLTPVSIAPVGTPVILLDEMEGESTKKFGIPSTSLTADDCSGNKLLSAPEGGLVVTDDGNTYYALANKSYGVGFYKVNVGVTIPQGKAYLVSSSFGAREFLGFDFDEGETTGLTDVRGKKEDVRGEYFNLNGQRVAQPTKGLYIVNGRKVIIK